MSSQTVVLITLVFYKLVLLGIGFWASKRIVSESDFFIAGKGDGGGLGPWVAGLSYAASTSSAWVLLGYTGFVFSVGFKALWLIPGIFGGYAITWLVMGPRLNMETAERGHITVVDFLIADVSDKWRGRIAALAALLIVFCFVFYVAAQFQAAGNAFSSTFGLGLVESVVLGAVIIVLPILCKHLLWSGHVCWCLLSLSLRRVVSDRLWIPCTPMKHQSILR